MFLSAQERTFLATIKASYPATKFTPHSILDMTCKYCRIIFVRECDTFELEILGK